MKMIDYFDYLVDEIHSVIAATNDENGDPVTCAIDIMDHDDEGLYFLTAKGKNFYRRLKQRQFIAFTGMKGSDTMSRVALSIRGKVVEIGPELLPRLFDKNPYMREIYPNAESASALTVFKIYRGSGEWFDLSKKPIERASFTFGGEEEKVSGYFINEKCIGCGICQSVCPQNCIDLTESKALINPSNCLHCGACFEKCPANAIERS